MEVLRFPPGRVRSEEERFREAMNLLKGVLEDDGEVDDSFKISSKGGYLLSRRLLLHGLLRKVSGRMSLAQLSRRKEVLGKKVEEGRGRVERRRLRLGRKKARWRTLERDFKEASERVEAHEAERYRREEERRALG